MSKLNEVVKSLYDLAPAELEKVRGECQRIKTEMAKDLIKVGSQVFLTREGNQDVYTVTKINRVKVVIKHNERNVSYNCPPGLLEVIEPTIQDDIMRTRR